MKFWGNDEWKCFLLVGNILGKMGVCMEFHWLELGDWEQGDLMTWNIKF